MSSLKSGSWLPALSSSVCLGLGAGLLGVYGFFSQHLAAEFDVGLTTINIGPLALILVPGLMGPYIGKLVDRVPIRRVILTGATISMAALYGVSYAPSLTLAALGFLFFALGLSMYGPVVINAMLVKLYPHHEARALSLAAMGISVASVILPPVVAWLLVSMEWRGALATLAVCLLGILWLAILSGLPPNPGGVAEGATRSSSRATSSVHYRHPAFWLIGWSIALGFNVSILLAVCYPGHFTSQGFSLSQAGIFIAISGVGGLAGKATLASLADKFKQHVKIMAALLMLCQLLGIAVLLAVDDFSMVLMALCLTGFGAGGSIPMHPFLNSQYFGSAVIGEVTGAQMPLLLPLALVGLPLSGYVFDQTGSYVLVFMGIAVALSLAAVLLLSLPNLEAQSR